MARKKLSDTNTTMQKPPTTFRGIREHAVKFMEIKFNDFLWI